MATIYEFDAAGSYVGSLDVPDNTTIVDEQYTWAPPPPDHPGTTVRFDVGCRQWRYISDEDPSVLPMIPVIIDSVRGDEEGFDNSHNEYTVKLGRELVITGPLPVPDQRFRVPCSMRDTGRTIAAVADVVGGQMTITVTLPELGYWETTAEMLNAGLPQPTFSLADPISFVVIP